MEYKVKKKVKNTRLARKMYPNCKEISNDEIEIEVLEEGNAFGLLTAQMISEAIAEMHGKMLAADHRVIISPKQFEGLQKLVGDKDD